MGQFFTPNRPDVEVVIELRIEVSAGCYACSANWPELGAEHCSLHTFANAVGLGLQWVPAGSSGLYNT
jgi:hypothetical protein